MENKVRTLLAALICALVIICAGTAVILVWNPGNLEKIYQKQIQVADKYFIDGDYENAVISYQAAIQKDKKKEEPYQRLAMIYLSRNEMALAQDILNLGILNTSSPSLQLMWAKYFEESTITAKTKTEQGIHIGRELKTKNKNFNREKKEKQGEQEVRQGEFFPVDGQVVDAVTGEGASGALINVRAEGKETGEILANAVADADGEYVLELESGYYLAEIELDGYLTEYFEMAVDAFGDIENGQFVLSPEVGSGQIRIVLEWDAAPRDLDSHLEGILSDGTIVNIFYRNKTLESGGQEVISLDVDDVDGYGPETTTINDINGKYRFYVIDFEQEGTLGENGATVKVYMPGEEEPIVITAPADAGNEWEVLQIEDGKCIH